MIKNLKQHYQNLLSKHGTSPFAVQYPNKTSQYKRFEILTSTIKQNDSIIDVGCGLGDMYQYLSEHQFNGKYLGLDFVDEFIELAIKKHSHNKNIDFQCFDLLTEKIPDNYDYILLSGVFNNNTPNNKEFMLNTLNKMFKSCKKGIAFNAMSTYVDYQDESLYYTNPLTIFDYCKRNLSSKVTLKHDYLLKKGSIPYEYTIYVYREDYE
jgi:SAM-dependent methyltransferase